MKQDFSCDFSLIEKRMILYSINFVIRFRGGVKLEFVRNSFDSIRKSKKYSKNSMKINSNSIRSIRLQLQAGSQNFRNLIRSKSVRFDSKICNSMIRKSKNNSKNSMKINSNLIHSIRLQLKAGVKFPEIRFVRNSFNSIRKFTIRLIRKVKKYSKNSIKINSKFIRFDSTSILELHFCGYISDCIKLSLNNTKQKIMQKPVVKKGPEKEPFI